MLAARTKVNLPPSLLGSPPSQHVAALNARFRFEISGSRPKPLDNIFKLHGMPEDIVSDEGPRFTSTFWTELMAMLGSKRSMRSAYHPQSDGQIERMNRVPKDMLRHYCV